MECLVKPGLHTHATHATVHAWGTRGESKMEQSHCEEEPLRVSVQCLSSFHGKIDRSLHPIASLDRATLLCSTGLLPREAGDAMFPLMKNVAVVNLVFPGLTVKLKV